MFTVSLISLVLFMAQTTDAQMGSFDDLGKLLFGGLLAAVLVAVVIVFLKMKSQNKAGASTDFVSISPAKHKDLS